MKKIENILKLVPLFSFLLIVASSVKLAVFYKVFNVNIVDYLSISEYIPLFIDDLHSILYIGSSILLGVMIGNSKKEEKKETDKETKSLRITHVISIVFIGIVTPIIIYFRYDSWYDRLEPFGVLFFVLMLSIAILYSTYKENISMRYVVSWLFLLLSVPVVVSGYRDAYKIIENKREVTYEINVNGNVLNDDNHHTFIGKSHNFIFLYNSCTNTAMVYPMDKVEKIDIIKIQKE